MEQTVYQLTDRQTDRQVDGQTHSTVHAMHEADSLHSLKRKLKTHLFTLCFND